MTKRNVCIGTEAFVGLKCVRTSTIDSFLFFHLSALYIHASKKVVSVSDTLTVNFMVSLWLFASSICIPQ